ncbi:hypothetical protein [Cloacibacillus sp. An23]|uniref:hypothetical protein n=1 Tax=Cloacibacillus sp. An23 TaxID=1965591 RepID=UPI000B365866|nr:hypothetical protein [Cloacibacillus sp. An23]OUO93002.1 hypothetical protein B5F39_09125 [Cloacibacillus sp. An23]
MTADIFSSLFRYFNAWLLICFAVAAAVVSEKIYFRFFAALAKRSGAADVPSVSFAGFFRRPAVLPGGARSNAPLYCPVPAFAALMTVWACLPVCTYIPIIDNGADMVQLAQFMLLSEVFVLISLYSTGSGEALETVRAEMKNMIRFLLPFMAACASIAAYLIKNGLDSDPFSFNSFSLFGQMRSMSWPGVAGVVIFVIAVLSQTPQRGAESGTLLLKEDELPDYDGAPRGILQVWSVLRAFIVIAAVTYIVFPSDLMGTFGESAAISWRGQAVNFVVFWISVGLMRICAVPLCRLILSLLERPLPAYARGCVVYLLSVCAVLLLWYEGILLSMEAAAF